MNSYENTEKKRPMITASVVTYDHHFLDIEPVLRSLFASPVDVIYIIDHSEHMMQLEAELKQFAKRVLTGEPELQKRVEAGMQLLYFRHDNNGYGGGHNFAMRKALSIGSEYHLVVNPDIWFGPRVIPELKKYMDKHRDVGQMMPKVLYPNGEIQRLAKMLPTPFDMFGRLCLPKFIINKRNRRFELEYSGFNMVLNVPFLSGCFMFFRMSAIQEINMFDEHFFLYGEDIDISRRMNERYKTLYYPKVPVYHKFSRGSRHSLHLLLVHIFSICKYFNKWGWFKDEQRTAINNALQEQIDKGGITD
ncbi:glycosyltransferase [Palleniella muris]|uniref:Glycosyltransferase n=1 Tax=Palleniella muris TaxID=3038145 RepID=A0AC61QTX1_9BACT|nr:glycosyltransferase [Palleniella muris]TGX84084.1 glycosyltransferase [Palleniella muris]